MHPQYHQWRELYKYKHYYVIPSFKSFNKSSLSLVDSSDFQKKVSCCLASLSSCTHHTVGHTGLDYSVCASSPCSGPDCRLRSWKQRRLTVMIRCLEPLPQSLAPTLSQAGEAQSPGGEQLVGKIHRALVKFWVGTFLPTERAQTRSGLWTDLAAWPAMAEAGPLMLWKNSHLFRSVSGSWSICHDSYSVFLSQVSPLEITWWTLWWAPAWAFGPSCWVCAAGTRISTSKKSQVAISRFFLNSDRP